MKSHKLIHVIAFVAGAVAVCSSLQYLTMKTASAAQHKEPKVVLTASASSVTLFAMCAPDDLPDPSCSPTSASVNLTAIPDNFGNDKDGILFSYMTTGGRITGEGPAVVWDLSGAAPGKYVATVEAKRGKKIATASVEIAVDRCECLPPPTPTPQPTPVATPTPPPPLSLPELWPLPQASTKSVIPSQWLSNNSGVTRLRDVSARLVTALNGAGFKDESWYAVPSGFALVTQFEQFRGDSGIPVGGSWRWTVTAKPPIEGGWDYVTALTTANPGHYRYFVFVVMKEALIQSESEVPFEEARHWIGRGGDSLPDEIGRIEFKVSEGYKCTALIYEYVKTAPKSPPTFVGQSRWQGLDHLDKSGILRGLRR